MIQVDHLCYQYQTHSGSLTALRDISLVIEEGASVAVMGPNGSGKTTLARCLNGLLRPSSGRVLVDGMRTDREEHIWPIRQRVGMIFQNPDNQLVSTQVEREIAFGLENLGIPTDQCHQRVNEALARFDLKGYRTYPPHLLSGGEKQRLAVASVWAMRPKYLILDEPTALLDARGRREVMRVLRELADQPDIAVIHITLCPEQAAEADRLIVLHHGEVILDNEPAAVFAHADTFRAIGLEVPKAAQLASALRTNGVSLFNGVTTTNSLVQALAQHRARMPRGALSCRATRSVSPSQADAPQKRVSPSAIIETRQLTHIYNLRLPTERLALSCVNLAVSSGDFFAVIGSTGSGKTTLVQHFNGLLKPTSGQVLADGVDLWHRGVDLQRVRQKIGLVFQFPELQLFEETAAKDVAFGPRNLGMPESELNECVRRAFDDVELDFDLLASRSPFELSEGEKRRLAIAGVLAMTSGLRADNSHCALVLDEPTAGLDHRGTQQISSVLRKLHATGRAVVMICHDMDLMAQLADRVLALDQGRVVYDGTPGGAFAKPDLLNDIGLDRPWTVHLACQLQALGWDIPPTVLTMHELQTQILLVLSAGTSDGA